MSAGFSTNHLSNPLEKFAKADTWNSYLSITDKPENILENGFTEVGLLTRIVEALKEAFGFESKMSKKALGDRFVTVIETLENHKVQVDERYLKSLMKLAERAKLYGNDDSQKDDLVLTQKFTHLQLEAQPLVAPAVLTLKEEAPSEKSVAKEVMEDAVEEVDQKNVFEQISVSVEEEPEVVLADHLEKVEQDLEAHWQAPASKSYSSTAWKLATCALIALVVSAAVVASSKPTSEGSDEETSKDPTDPTNVENENLKWAETVARKPCVAGPVITFNDTRSLTDTTNSPVIEEFSWDLHNSYDSKAKIEDDANDNSTLSDIDSQSPYAKEFMFSAKVNEYANYRSRQKMNRQGYEEKQKEQFKPRSAPNCNTLACWVQQIFFAQPEY